MGEIIDGWVVKKPKDNHTTNYREIKTAVAYTFHPVPLNMYSPFNTGAGTVTSSYTVTWGTSGSGGRGIYE